MCYPRNLTSKEMDGYSKWKQELIHEDIREFGEEVKRDEKAYLFLYRMYLDYGKE